VTDLATEPVTEPAAEKASEPVRERRSRWERWARPWVHVVAVVVLLGTTVSLIAVYSVLLHRMSQQVEQAQARSANLSNADRETLVLLQAVTQLDADSDPDEIDLHRGVSGRQIVVSIASFDDGAPEARELTDVRARLAAFPWDRLVATRGRDDALRRTGMAVVAAAEERINVLRSAQEQQFYRVTTASLAANQRGQLALAALVTLVLGLGVAGITVVLRRSRSAVEQAYTALKGEVAERRVAEEALRASEGRFRSLVQRASDLTIVTDDQGIVTYVSPAVEALVGYLPAELIGLPLLVHVEPAERADVATAITLLAERPGLLRTIELRLRSRDGRVRTVEAVCQNMVDDPDVHGLVWNGRDVTERRALESELTHRAHHDPLTGLPNRALLLRRLDETMAEAARGRVGVAIVDLDGFKNVNDTLGHPAGDELLEAAAQRLLGCIREGDLVARLGGDEFAVMMAGVDGAHAAAIARRMVDVLHEPFTVSGHQLTVGASVGVAHGTPDGTAHDLMRDADIAMYVAKRTGKGRVSLFEPDMRIRASHRTRLQQELARAVERGEIDVAYQPIIHLESGRTVMLEALARWRRPGQPPVPAEVFIALAEESGAINKIGPEVLRQACHAAQGWRHLPGYAELGIAVNVSVHQILSGQLVEHVVEVLRDSGLPPTLLALEITESAALGDSDRVAAEFRQLQAMGVGIAVDDFGAGYSSLGLLMSLDVDTLKIDRSLLDFDTTRRGSLVMAITELGHTLGLKVVAEGVETPSHLHRAREACCDAVQGYHLSRPLEAGAVGHFLTTWAGSRLANPVSRG
jgi:diguanylate cyclase (GGDEF)-like protein/PAS domain S-box-containing protein